jgi:hypothetical protein
MQVEETSSIAIEFSPTIELAIEVEEVVESTTAKMKKKKKEKVKVNMKEKTRHEAK